MKYTGDYGGVVLIAETEEDQVLLRQLFPLIEGQQGGYEGGNPILTDEGVEHFNISKGILALMLDR